MSNKSNNPRRRRRRVVLAGAGLVALSGPGQTAGFSVFVDPLLVALDVSRGGLTIAYLVGTLAASTTGSWLGRVADRRPMHGVVRLVAVLLAASLIVASLSPNLIVLTVAIYGIRSFGQTGMTLSASVFVARSVRRRRGAALGLLTAVGGSSISLTPLVASRVITAVGWRWTWVMLAGVVFVGGNLAAVAVGRLERSSGDHGSDVTVDEGAHTDRVVVDATPWARRRNGFALVAAAFTCNGVVATSLAFHQIALLGERGLTAAQAATNFLPQSLASAAVALGVGRLVDRFPGRWVLVGDMTLLCAATVAVTRVEGPLGAAAFGMMLGSATAATASSEGALLARWVGTDQLGMWRGRMMTMVVVGTALAPLAFDLLASSTGSFTSAAVVLACVPAMVAIGALAIRLPDEHPSASAMMR